MIKDVTVKLGLPSKLIHSETGKVLNSYPPYTNYEMAQFDVDKSEGITHYSFGKYPHKIVFGKLGAKFAGYIT